MNVRKKCKKRVDIKLALYKNFKSSVHILLDLQKNSRLGQAGYRQGDTKNIQLLGHRKVLNMNERKKVYI